MGDDLRFRACIKLMEWLEPRLCQQARRHRLSGSVVVEALIRLVVEQIGQDPAVPSSEVRRLLLVIVDELLKVRDQHIGETAPS